MDATKIKGAVGSSLDPEIAIGANGPADPVFYVKEPTQLEFSFMNDYYVPPVTPKADNINHPNHYTAGKIEVFDFIKAWGLSFAAGNVVKYVVRSPYKGKQLEDLKKARWYLDRLIEEAQKNA